MYVNILNYAGRRYLWWSLLLVLLSLLLYFSQPPGLPRSGGSWQGYTLGGMAALLIVWLAWLGIRKRRYRLEGSPLQGWVSAHVYLGLALPVIATLHCAFQFGLSIHMLAYLLLLAVVASGLYGLYAYLRLPQRMAINRDNQSLDERLQELDRLDQLGLDTAAGCEESVSAIVNSAIERTALGGGFRDQLLARDRSRVLLAATSERTGRTKLVSNRDQQPVIDYLVRKVPDSSKSGEAEKLRELLYVFGRRAELLRRIRREQSWLLRLKLWLCFHIPLSVGLLAALLAHIFAVFFYW